MRVESNNLMGERMKIRLLICLLLSLCALNATIPFGTPVEVYAGSDLFTAIPFKTFKSLFLKIGSTFYVGCANNWLGSPQIFFSKSVDGGATWTPGTAFTFNLFIGEGPHQETYSFAFDGSDNAYFADEAPITDNLTIHKYTFSTDTWSLVSDTGPVRETPRGPQNIILFSDGTFGIVCRRSGLINQFDYVTYNGTTWTVVEDIQPTNAEGWLEPELAFPYLTTSGAIQYFRPFYPPPAGVSQSVSVIMGQDGTFISRSMLPIGDSDGFSVGTVSLSSSLAALIGRGPFVSGNATYYALLSADSGATWALKSTITISVPENWSIATGWLTADSANLYWAYNNNGDFLDSGTLIQIRASSNSGATWSTQTLDVAGTGLTAVGQPSFIPGVGLFFSGNDGIVSSIWFVPLIAPSPSACCVACSFLGGKSSSY
jgi:hypothetical protein